MDRDEEIKNEFIQRAEIERNNLLREIERLITSVLPGAKQDFENTFSTFIDMARQMDVLFSADRDMENVIEQYINNLLVLKTELENLEITEEVLLEDTVMNKAQQIIPLIEPSILEAKNNLYNSNKNILLRGSRQRENIESKILELEKQKMYLQGKLDATIIKKLGAGIEVRIKDLDAEIELLENELSELEFKEDTTIPKSDGEMPLVSQSNTIPKSREQQGQEPNDDGIR